MIEIRVDYFDTAKAKELLQKYSDNRELLKTCLVNDLITYQDKFPKSILYCELLVKKCYNKELITSVLEDLGYVLIDYKDHSEFKKDTELKSPAYSLIVFGLAEG